MTTTAVAAPPIRAPRQIQALASGIRQDIVDALESNGPSSLRELGALLGLRPDALYYHVRVLREAGLVIDGGEERADPSAPAIIDLAIRPSQLRYAPADRRNRESVCAVVASMTRSAERRFRRAFRPGRSVVEGPHRDLWAGRCQGWLADEDLEQVNAHLAAILEIIRARQRPSTGNAKRRELTFVLVPLADRRSTSA